MIKRARIGVIGRGWWATYAHLPALMSYPRAEVTAIADSSPERLARAAEHFGITNNFERRVAQHGERFQVIEKLNLQLTRNEARVVEQKLIEEYGGAVSQGGTLANKINSIAEGGPLWGVVLQTTLSFVDISAVLGAVSAADLPCVP